MPYTREISSSIFWVCGYNKPNKFNEGDLVFADAWENPSWNWGDVVGVITVLKAEVEMVPAVAADWLIVVAELVMDMADLKVIAIAVDIITVEQMNLNTKIRGMRDVE